MLDHWILNKYQIKNSLLCVSLAVRRDCQLDYNVVDVLKLLLSFFRNFTWKPTIRKKIKNKSRDRPKYFSWSSRAKDGRSKTENNFKCNQRKKKRRVSRETWRSGSDSGRWTWGRRSREGWRELLGLIGRVTRGLTGCELQGSAGREGASGFHLSPVMLTRQARATTLTPELYTDQRAIPPTSASMPTAALSDPEPVWSERPVIRWLEQTAVWGKGMGWVDSAALACRALQTL